MEFQNVIDKRRTTRQFSNRPVEKDKIQRIIEAGIKAPSFDHMRRWDFIVITDEDWQGTKYTTMPAQDITFNSPQDIVDRLNALDAEEEEDKKIYDLSGRRLSSMKAKGLYIVNGKKILKQ